MKKLSLCLITKDEEANIAGCLESVREAAGEIILVDTGSQDDTIRIASGYGARIYEFPWTGDFAAARNEALKYATGDWILSLDADERLDLKNCNKIRQLLETPSCQAYLLQLRSPYPLTKTIEGINTALAVRIFKNNIGIRYQGRLHESIVTHTGDTKLSVANTNITIDHLGYRGDMDKKWRRNLSLNRLQNKQDDAFYRFDMARTNIGLGQHKEAEEELQRGIEITGTAEWLRAYMYVMVGDLLSITGKETEAMTAWKQAAELDRNIVAPRLRLGRTCFSRGEFGVACQQFERVVELLSIGSLRGAVLDDECTLAQAYDSLIACYLKAGRLRDAAAALTGSRLSGADDEALKVVPWKTVDEPE
jgi:glycosyltransferase involved in cell wall biosynthesis